MKSINLLNIRVDGKTQSRAELNQERVTEYAEMIREGIDFPPITVFYDGSDYWLSSGFHRYFASKQAGKASIDCEIQEGTVTDALWFSLGSNNHGLNKTAEDKRFMMQIIIDNPVWSKISNNKIAAHIGISNMTVSRIRKELDVKPSEISYTDKNGRKATISTENMGRPKSPKPEEEENVSPIKDEKDQIIAELTDTVNLLAEENTLFRDKIAMGQWNASEIEKIDIEETVANLRERNRILEIENKALRESRDMFQNRNAELIKTINAMKRKDKK